MRRSYFPRRFLHCTLSKGHSMECHFEELIGEGVLEPAGVNPVDPRCLKMAEKLKDDFIHESSHVFHVYVPIQTNGDQNK